ncbi:hypothetical protein [Streptomyces sp. NPDC051001]|uniref:hypothetical protein n=1 Tax=Streptomyces sp. NPDC051001 TaxID=3155795 RepID=UPI00342BF18D
MTDLASAPSPDSSRAPGAVRVRLTEVPALRGRTFVGDWFAVDQDRLPAFEHATYLDQDEDQGEATFAEDFYPDGLIEGFHLLGLLDRLMSDTFGPEAGTVEGWNYGLDRVRFVSPVLVGERMRLHATVEEVEPKGEGHVLLLKCVVEVEGRERPGFTADWRVLWLPADAADASASREKEAADD